MKIIHVNRINVSISGNNHTSKNYTDTDIYIFSNICGGNFQNSESVLSRW